MDSKVITGIKGNGMHEAWSSDAPEQRFEAPTADEAIGKLYTYRLSAATGVPVRVGEVNTMPKDVKIDMSDSVQPTEKIEAKSALEAQALEFASFASCIQMGKRVTVSCWRKGDPAVQGYGNSQKEAHADLLAKEKAIKGGQELKKS